MKTIDSTAAKKKLAELRRINPKSYVTNYFLNPLAEELLCLENENAIILLNPDRHIHRLIFAYLDLSDFEKLLCELPEGLQISLEIVTKKDLDEGLRATLERHLLYDTTFIRISCKLENARKLDMDYGDEVGFATIEDVPEIERILRDTFSYHYAHYPDEEELKYLIGEKQVIILKRKEIVGLYIFKKVGRLINSDQLINRDNNPTSVLKLWTFFLKNLKHLDVDEFYGWVDIEKNMRVQKMNNFIGYKSDGLKNIIFINSLLRNKLNK